MGSKQSETERQHNRGQEDRSSGRDYRPPRDFLGGVFNSEASKAQRDAYVDGWENAKKQEK